MLDRFDVTSDFVHVASNVLEVGFKLGKSRFHINVSSGFGAAFRIGFMQYVTVTGGYGRAHRFFGINALHESIRLLLRVGVGN